MLRLGSAVAAFAAASTIAAEASAGPKRVAVTLDGDDCIGARAVADAVAARGAEVDPDAPVRLRVRVLGSDAAGAVHVDVTGENDRGALTDRSLDAASCAEALDAVALLVALAADEQAAPSPPAAPAPAPPPPVVASTAPSMQPADRTPLAPARESERTSRCFEASAAMTGTSLGEGQLGARASVGLRWRRALFPWIEGSVGANVPSAVEGGGGRAKLAWMTARMAVAPVALELDRATLLSLYAGAEAGAVHGAGEGTSRVQTQTRPWLAAIAGARLTWDASDRLFVGGSAGVVVPVVRDEFVFLNGGTVYGVPALAAEAAIFAGAHFP